MDDDTTETPVEGTTPLQRFLSKLGRAHVERRTSFALATPRAGRRTRIYLHSIYCRVSARAMRTARSTLAMSSLFPSSCTTSDPNEYTSISRAVIGSIPRDWK